MTDAARCPHAVDVAAFVQDELPRARRSAFEVHLQGCASCAREVRSTRALLGDLARLSVREAPRVHTASPWRPMAAAAGLLALVSGVLAWAFAEPGPVTPTGVATMAAVDPAVQLSAGLSAEGTWSDVVAASPARRTSLHALALLALARGAGEPDAVRRAGDWLLQQQSEDGVVGTGLGDGSTDQVLATLALTEAARRTGAGELERAARAAAAAFVAQAGEQRLNPAQAAWAGQALDAAASWGVAGVDHARQRLSSDHEALGRGRPAPTLAVAEATPHGTVGRLHATCAAVLASSAP